MTLEVVSLVTNPYNCIEEDEYWSLKLNADKVIVLIPAMRPMRAKVGVMKILLLPIEQKN